MKKFIQTKSEKRDIADWTTEDACDWLKSNRLDDDMSLTKQFQNAKITGNDLAEAEMAWENMNLLKFKNSHHKQDVLLKLAEVLRESRSRVETKSKTMKQRLTPSITHSTEALTSSDYVSGSSSSSTATTPSSSSDQDRFGDVSVTSSATSTPSRMMKKLNNIKQAMGKLKSHTSEVTSPAMTSSGSLHSIIVFSDLLGNDLFTETQLSITETTTTIELIQIFLDCASITDDNNLFVIHDVTIPINDPKEKKERITMKSRRLLERDECPLAIYRSYTSSPRPRVTRRLEMTQTKGVMIKITCQIGKHKPRGKQLRVSKQSSVDHVIRLALRKFRLRNVDSSLFVLCELTIDGAIVEIQEGKRRQWNNGSTVILSDKTSIRQKNGGSDVLPDFSRSLSVTSNASHASKNSKDSATSESWKHLDGVTSLKSIDSCDVMTLNAIDFKKDDSTANADCYLVENSLLRAQLREREEQADETFQKVSQVRQMLEGGLQSYRDSNYQQVEGGSSVAIEADMRATEEHINNTEQMLGQLFRHQRQLLSKQMGNTQDSDDVTDKGLLADVELQIAVHQSDLLILKHKYQMLDMKMSLFVSHRKAEKFRHMISGSLYNIISSKTEEKCHAVFTCEIFPGDDGYKISMKEERETTRNGVIIKGTVIQTDDDKVGLIQDDRLLEINGINVQTASLDFVNKLLKGSNSCKIVALRKFNRSCNCDIHNGDGDVIDREMTSQKPSNEKMSDWREMNALKRDLQMLMRELEVTSQANKELERDLARQKTINKALQRENNSLQQEL
ncbi:uncharacterized protein LOC100187130 [Ciona intestinalis]